MPNAEKIRETLAVARANQHRLKMRKWADGKVNPNAASWRECGVSFCLAGWRAVLDGLRPLAFEDGSVTGCFIGSDGRTWRADDWATVSMELEGDQPHRLFVATQDVTNIDVLDWIAEQIIAGRDVSECENCKGEGVDYCAEEPCGECEGRGFLVERSAL